MTKESLDHRRAAQAPDTRHRGVGHADGPRIMIVGGNFVGKGAEAMLLTVRDAVEAALPRATCCAPASDHDVGERYAAERIVPVVRRLRTRGMHRVQRWLAVTGRARPSRVDPARLQRKRLDIVNPYRCSDALVDIRGFSGSDEFGPRAAIERYRGYELAAASGNKVILMPQSWGPLRDPVVRDYVARLVKLSDLVFAREKESLEYLAELPGLDPSRLVLAPDIAFQFRSAPAEVGRKVLARLGVADTSDPVIGITPNMRIVERTPGTGEQNEYFRGLLETARWFLDNTRARIVLIPHERTPGRVNDPELCSSLVEMLGQPGRLVQLSGEESAAEVKAVIKVLDFLIASRYHSLVAAMSARTPVAVIGWSHKYDELMERAGLAEWVLDPARRPGGESLDLVIEAWRRRAEIKSVLGLRVPELEAGSRAALDRMLEELVRP